MGFDGAPNLGYDSDPKMSFRLSHFQARRAAIFAAGALVMALVSASQSHSQGVPIEFSEPQAGVVSTNLNQLGLVGSDSKDPEDGFSKPQSAFTFGNSSLDAVQPLALAPPAIRATVPDRRAKDRLDSNGNWVFATPEELMPALTPEAILGVPEYGPDGKDKGSLSPMERYYDRMMSDRGARKPGKTASSDSGIFSADQNDAAIDGLPGDLSKTERTLKSFAKPESGFGLFSDSSASSGNSPGPWDSFGFSSANSVTPESLHAQQQAIQVRDKELEKIWNYNQPVVPLTPEPVRHPVVAEAPRAPTVLNPYKDKELRGWPYETSRPWLQSGYPGQSSLAPVSSAEQQQTQPGRLRPLLFDFPRRNFD